MDVKTDYEAGETLKNKGFTDMDQKLVDFYSRIAHGIAGQFGDHCEVLIHDLTGTDPDHTIVYIENGHVSGRKKGDAASQVVLEALADPDRDRLQDRIGYIARTDDGRIMRSSTIYLHDRDGRTAGILGINYDISPLMEAEHMLEQLTGEQAKENPVSETMSFHVGQMLDRLIIQSVRAVGKPAEEMNREDRLKFIRLLNDRGAFLIAKSGPRVCQYLGISKYTLYSYLDEVKKKNE